MHTRWRIALDTLLFIGAAVMFFLANNFLLGMACLIPACLICLGLPTRHGPHFEHYTEKEN